MAYPTETERVPFDCIVEHAFATRDEFDVRLLSCICTRRAPGSLCARCSRPWQLQLHGPTNALLHSVQVRAALEPLDLDLDLCR